MKVKDLTWAELRKIIERHADSEGFCRSCFQPWPCDMKVVSSWALRNGGR